MDAPNAMSQIACGAHTTRLLAWDASWATG